MTEQQKKLLELQDLDGRIRELRRAMQEMPADVVAKKRGLAALAHSVEELDQSIKKVKAEAGKHELELKTGSDKITKLEVQLNSAKTNKEYAAFQSEIGGLKADMSLIEDKILALLSKVDEMTAQKASFQKKVDAEKNVCSEAEKAVRARSGEVNVTLEVLTRDRAERAKEISPDYLALYERILANKGDVALVSARDGLCHGCFMGMTRQMLNLLVQGEQTVQCKSCNRLLYLEAEQIAAYRNQGRE
jgi:uncharacterized protein